MLIFHIFSAVKSLKIENEKKFLMFEYQNHINPYTLYPCTLWYSMTNWVTKRAHSSGYA